MGWLSSAEVVVARKRLLGVGEKKKKHLVLDSVATAAAGADAQSFGVVEERSWARGFRARCLCAASLRARARGEYRRAVAKRPMT